MSVEKSQFVIEIEKMAEKIHTISTDNGWWAGNINIGEAIALIHFELSAALAATNDANNKPSKHLSRRLAVEEDLAGVIIRIMDMAYEKGWNIAEAIEDKVSFVGKQSWADSLLGRALLEYRDEQ